MAGTDPSPAVAPGAPLVLVVDDEFDIAVTYSMLFEYRGFRVVTAANGVEALAAVARETPDIVVSDYMMPLMNGAQLCLELRRVVTDRPLPFILMSAGALEQQIGAPFDLFLKKPVAFDTLLKHVQRLLASALPPAP